MIKLKLHSVHIKVGVSLIEILILLLIVSIFATSVIPTFVNKQRDAVKKDFIANFTTLMKDSLYQAITTSKVHQIYFDFNQNQIIPKVQDLSVDAQSKHSKFKPISNNSNASIAIPQHITVRNFFIQNEDELSNKSKLDDAWFYIMPDGTSQSIIMNLEYSDPESQDIEQFAITINPFYSQVTQHETFQKP